MSKGNTTAFDAITKDKPTLAGFLRSLPCIEAPYQFSGYEPEYPVKEEFALLAADVLTRYRAERDGEENVGRVLPAEYCFFTGDGRRNHFTAEWKSTDCFGWTLESPYTD